MSAKQTSWQKRLARMTPTERDRYLESERLRLKAKRAGQQTKQTETPVSVGTEWRETMSRRSGEWIEHDPPHERTMIGELPSGTVVRFECGIIYEIVRHWSGMSGTEVFERGERVRQTKTFVTSDGEEIEFTSTRSRTVAISSYAIVAALLTRD